MPAQNFGQRIEYMNYCINMSSFVFTEYHISGDRTPLSIRTLFLLDRHFFALNNTFFKVKLAKYPIMRHLRALKNEQNAGVLLPRIRQFNLCLNSISQLILWQLQLYDVAKVVVQVRFFLLCLILRWQGYLGLWDLLNVSNNFLTFPTCTSKHRASPHSKAQNLFFSNNLMFCLHESSY